MPIEGVYNLQKKFADESNKMLNSQWSAQYNMWLLCSAKQAQYTNSKSKALQNNLKISSMIRTYPYYQSVCTQALPI